MVLLESELSSFATQTGVPEFPSSGPLVYSPQLRSVEQAKLHRQAARNLAKNGIKGIRVRETEQAGDTYFWVDGYTQVPDGFVRIAMTYPNASVRDLFWGEYDKLREKLHQEITGTPSGLLGRGPEQQALARRRYANAQRRRRAA